MHRLRVLQGVEHLLQLGHLPLGILHPALLDRLLHLLGELLRILGVHLPALGVRHLRVRVAPELFGQRLQMLLDRLLQRLDALLDLPGRQLLAALLGVHGVAQGLARLRQRARGAVGQAFLQPERELPELRLHRRHRFGDRGRRTAARWPCAG